MEGGEQVLASYETKSDAFKLPISLIDGVCVPDCMPYLLKCLPEGTPMNIS